jgi:hypothetical protein
LTSERQTSANRANALRSTGPQTAKGKAAIRLNAVRHGLLARDVVLPEEDPDAFEELRNQVRASLSPIGPIEDFLVDQVVNAMWRLQRLTRAETLLFHSRMHAVKANRISNEVHSYDPYRIDCRGRSRPYGSKRGASARCLRIRSGRGSSRTSI